MKVDSNSLVPQMAILRTKGFNAHHFVSLVKRRGDAETSTGREKLQFLAFGSPALRYILHQVRTYVLPQTAEGKTNKLLLLEDVPLSAQFWEMVLNFVYVETGVLHSKLSDGERIELVKRFNDAEDSLSILILMHSVSAQGMNLDACCCRVLVITNAINAPLEWQGWGRVIRVLMP